MKRILGYLGAALALLFVVAGSLPASAATSNDTSSALSIEPRRNLVVNPGQTVNDKLTVSNLSHTADLDISLRIIDFTFTDQSGTPKLFLAQGAPQTAWSLKPFLHLPKDVVIPAGQSRTIEYSVTVPKNQGAGSYYSAIEYAAGGSNGGNVNLSASGVSLMFVSVPGIVHEDVTLQKLGAFQSSNGGVTGGFTFINANEPKYLAYTLKNNGNVAESPTGSMTLKDMWGKIITTVKNTNPNSSLALIGQTRLFTSCIKTASTQVNLQGATTKSQICADPHLKPGRYTVSLDAFYGQNGNQTREVTGTASFWYLPWWFLAAVLVIILLIVFFIWWLRRKIRKATQARAAGKRTFRAGSR